MYTMFLDLVLFPSSGY